MGSPRANQIHPIRTTQKTNWNQVGWRKGFCVKAKKWVYLVLTMNKTLNLKKGDTPVRASQAFVLEPAKSWQRLQQAKDFFGDIEVQAQEQHQQFLNQLMEYELAQFWAKEVCPTKSAYRPSFSKPVPFSTKSKSASFTRRGPT
jgi:hypothetical protein